MNAAELVDDGDRRDVEQGAIDERFVAAPATIHEDVTRIVFAALVKRRCSGRLAR